MHAFGTLALRLAEGRVGEHRDTRFVTHAPRETSRALRNVGQLLGIGQVMDGGVRHDNAAPAAQGDRDADNALTRARIDHPPDILQSG
ncbi:hypothetical protein D9M72_640970 [compost metagenome]